MERMFEVLRFIEHGAHCRQSVDFVRGQLLADYLRGCKWIDKTKLFQWFRQIAIQTEQYERSRNGKNYRYLNPYGIVVTEGEEVLLLNMESEENEFVKKKMQKRAVRTHFVKPMYDLKKTGCSDADLFAYGKTVQFILAYTENMIDLTKGETRRLSKVIDRCLNDNRKKYSEFRQVIRELPVSIERQAANKRFLPGVKGKMAVGMILVSLCCIVLVARGMKADGEEEKEHQSVVEIQEKSSQEDQFVKEKELLEKEDPLLVPEQVEQYLSEQPNPRLVVEKGENIQKVVLWKLSEAYETMKLYDEQKAVYEQLKLLEDDEQMLDVIRKKLEGLEKILESREKQENASTEEPDEGVTEETIEETANKTEDETVNETENEIVSETVKEPGREVAGEESEIQEISEYGK